MLRLFRKKTGLDKNEKALNYVQNKLIEINTRLWRLENPIRFKLGQRVKWGGHNEFSGLYTETRKAGTGIICEVPPDFSHEYKIACGEMVVRIRDRHLKEA